MSDDSLNRLMRRFSAIPEQIRKDVAAEVQRGADYMVATAKRFAPNGEGDLDASIRSEPGDHALQARVMAGGETTTRPVREGISATYDYAKAVEWGTENMEAQPYFYPAARLTRRRIKRNVNRAIRKAVKGQANG